MSGSNAKAELFDQRASVAKALSHPVRLELLEHLGQGERSVDFPGNLRRHNAELERVLSFEAVAELRKKGFKARRLEEGYPDWKAAGLPISTLARRYAHASTGT